MNNKEQRIPVFLINGFLEAGKTKFINFTLEQDYFKTDGTTLLIVCEEGEEDYHTDVLGKFNTDIVYIEDKENISIPKFLELEKKYSPERILIEWNGMWMQDELKIPPLWFINQTISIFDTSTMDLYLKNMKPFMGPMLKNSELVICNRADNISEEKLGEYYLALKAMASEAEIVFEGEEGEIRGDFCIQTPYDIDSDKITVKPEHFGIFFVDTMDRSERYDGKDVEFSAQVLRVPGFPKNCLVAGRKCMTCCEADMQFLGFICFYDGADAFKNRDWIKVRAKLKSEYNKQYGRVGPVLYAFDIVRTGPLDEVVAF